MRILVVGVGNPILSDDGVGIHVARILRDRHLKGVEVEELPASGLELLDMVLGYERVIIVDAIQTKSVEAGTLHRLKEEDFERTIHGSSPHGINIATALALGRKLVPEKMPKEVLFFAVEADDVVNVSENLTPKVADALPEILKAIEQELR